MIGKKALKCTWLVTLAVLLARLGSAVVAEMTAVLVMVPALVGARVTMVIAGAEPVVRLGRVQVIMPAA